MIKLTTKPQFKILILILMILVGALGCSFEIRHNLLKNDKETPVQSQVREKTQQTQKLYKDLKYWLIRGKWKIADLITGDILLHILERTEPG